MIQSFIGVTVLGLFSIFTWNIASAVETGDSRDPVMLTFLSGDDRLRLELGCIEEIAVVSQVEGFALNVKIDPSCLQNYRKMVNVVGDKPVDLYVCRDNLSTLGGVLEMKRESIVLSGFHDRSRAEEITDFMWSGRDCDLYL